MQQNTIVQLQKQNVQLSQKTKALAKQQLAVDERASALEKETEELRERNETLLAQLRAAESKIASLEAENAALKHSLAEGERTRKAPNARDEVAIPMTAEPSAPQRNVAKDTPK